MTFTVKFRFAGFLLAGMLAMSGATHAAQYCVAPNGSDTNLGVYPADAPNDPTKQCWKTPSQAVSKAIAGDNVCFMTGVWTGPITFSRSGESARPIVWRACKGAAPKLNQRADVHDRRTFSVTGSYQEFRDFITEVTYNGHASSAGEGEAIWAISGKHVVIDGITVQGMNARGQELGADYHKGHPRRIEYTDPVVFVHLMSGADYAQVRNSKLRHISKFGISVDHSAFHAKITNNQIYDVADRPIGIGACNAPSCGTYPNYQLRGVLIESNFLCGVWREDAVQTNEDSRVGDQNPLSTPGVVVRNNVMCNINENALDLKGGTKWLVEGNIAYGLADGDLVMHGSGTEGDETIVRNNVVFDSASGSFVFGRSSLYGNTMLHNRRNYIQPDDPVGTPGGCGITTPYPYPYSLSGLKIGWSKYGKGEALNNTSGNNLFEVDLQQYAHTTRIDGNLYWNDIEGKARFTSKGENDLRGVDFATWKVRLAARNVPGSDANARELNSTADYFRAPAGLAKICCPHCLGTVNLSTLANAWQDGLLTWHKSFDFTPKESYRNAGVDLTHTVGSGSGTTLNVQSAKGFYDGAWAPAHTRGDLIVIGSIATGTMARVTGRDVDSTPNKLFLDRSISWSANQPVNVVFELDNNQRPSSTSKNQGSFHHVRFSSPPSLSFSANPTQVGSGGNTTLAWSSTNASSCSASGGWSGSKPSSGNQSVGPLTSNTVFSLTCTGGGGSVSRSVTVTVVPPPSVTLSASPASVPSGGATTLTWSSSNASTCSASGHSTWSGAKSTSGSQSVGPLSANTTFSLSCSGVGGSTSRSVTVTIASVRLAVTGLTLMNADTNQPIGGFNPIANGATLKLSALPTRNVNIRANTAGNVGSVRFTLNGNLVRIENVAPYALMGDTQGDYVAWTPPLGSQSAGATAYPQPNAGGTAGGGVTVNFTVTP